jgi:ClpP class serine protease
MRRIERIAIIEQIEQHRESKVISYFCSDRQNASAQIGNDAVRPIYDIARSFGHVEKIDLFLYSLGGSVDVPWRLVSMLREHCNHLAVLIPYQAMSAATMIAIGCDEIVLGPKAELGPIDPALSRIRTENGVQFQEEIRVEDIMSYITFLKEKAGLTDQNVLSSSIQVLAEKLTPQLLGSVNRTHFHIRQVAQKLLNSHTKKIESERVEKIVEILAEKTYAHGHNINRNEAKEIGLPVTFPNNELELLMWQLLNEYEEMLNLKMPFDVETLNLLDFCGSSSLLVQPQKWSIYSESN